jgi:hypothetical protein
MRPHYPAMVGSCQAWRARAAAPGNRQASQILVVKFGLRQLLDCLDELLVPG